MRMLWFAHSGLRYLVLLAAVALLVISLMGWRTQRPGPKGMRIVGAIFVSLLDVQVLLGIMLLIFGSWESAIWGHIACMGMAVAVAHVATVWGRTKPNGTYFWPLVGALVSLGLIALGVKLLGRPLLPSIAA